MKHVTPPTNGTPLDRPQDVIQTLSDGLLAQQRQREEDIQRLCKLRWDASQEVERLLVLLDELDGYTLSELEEAVDDGPCDDDERDDDQVDDEETHDDEPSLGSLSSNGGDQSRWGSNDTCQFLDAEDEHDGGEPDDECDGKPDHEPSLGWPEHIAQGPGLWGGTDDREAAAEPEVTDAGRQTYFRNRHGEASRTP